MRFLDAWSGFEADRTVQLRLAVADQGDRVGSAGAVGRHADSGVGLRIRAFVPKTVRMAPPVVAAMLRAIFAASSVRTIPTHPRATPKQSSIRRVWGQSRGCPTWEHAVSENRHGLIVDVRVTEAKQRHRAYAALDMLAQASGANRCTVGADKAYDVRKFVEDACTLM